MRAVGIIAEFNPFHNGHRIHIEESKAVSGRKSAVAVMSGSFVQRGEPAIASKWARAKAALLCGADMVVELPVHYCLMGADYFARGAVGILEALGIVDALSFGCECGELGAIKAAAEILANEPAEYRGALRSGLSRGLSFAAARGLALAECMPEAPEGIFALPNNGLGIEYVKALRLIGSGMEVYATHRKEGGPSATRARRALLGGRMPTEVPMETLCLLEGRPARLDDYSSVFRYLLFCGERELSFGEGLENRFRQMAERHETLSGLLAAVKTKRYTRTRLQRLALRAVLGLGDSVCGPPYIRLLGFRKKSERLVGELTERAALPVITSGKDIDRLLSEKSAASDMLRKELEAGDIYRTLSMEPGRHRHERREPLVIV